jgi:hypothetical protein
MNRSERKQEASPEAHSGMQENLCINGPEMRKGSNLSGDFSYYGKTLD